MTRQERSGRSASVARDFDRVRKELLALGDSSTLDVGTAAGTVAAGDDSRITGAAQKASNLSDLASASTARTNLGLRSGATVRVDTGSPNVTTDVDGKFTVTFSTAFTTTPVVVLQVQNAGTAHRHAVVNSISASSFTATLFDATSGNAPVTDDLATRTVNWIAIGT